MARLPLPGSDDGAWGTVLNDFLRVAHNENGTLQGVMEVLNIVDFGAVGDGVIDDTQAIQTAIDQAIQSNGNTGSMIKTVYIPPAAVHYRTTQALRIVESVQLIGGGVQSLSGSGVQPTIWQDGNAEPVFVVDTPVNQIVIIDNLRIVGGTKGIDFAGQSLSRHSRFRYLQIHGCTEVGIDIRSGMIGAQFEDVHVRNSPDYGIRCKNTSNLISVRFVACRIVGTKIAALYLKNPHQSSQHGISFVSPIIESNKGSGIVISGGYQIRRLLVAIDKKLSISTELFVDAKKL